ncbi:MAG: sulfurtransferase, partial [Chthoniobacteraceae bacterium]
MKPIHKLAIAATVALFINGAAAFADIGVISPADAKKLIEDPNPAKRPVVLDTRGGYKDYFRGHLPT